MTRNSCSALRRAASRLERQVREALAASVRAATRAPAIRASASAALARLEVLPHDPVPDHRRRCRGASSSPPRKSAARAASTVAGTCAATASAPRSRSRRSVLVGPDVRREPQPTLGGRAGRPAATSQPSRSTTCSGPCQGRDAARATQSRRHTADVAGPTERRPRASTRNRSARRLRPALARSRTAAPATVARRAGAAARRSAPRPGRPRWSAAAGRADSRSSSRCSREQARAGRPTRPSSVAGAADRRVGRAQSRCPSLEHQPVHAAHQAQGERRRTRVVLVPAQHVAPSVRRPRRRRRLDRSRSS